MEDSGNNEENYRVSPQLKLLTVVTLFVGCFLGILFVFRSMLLFLRQKGTETDWMHRMLESSIAVGETRLMTAAENKVMRLLIDAAEYHRSTPTDGKRQEGIWAMHVSGTPQEASEKRSFMSIAKQIYSGELFTVEGIWIPTRLLVICGAQVAVWTLSIFFASVASTGVTDRFESARQELPFDSPDWVKR